MMGHANPTLVNKGLRSCSGLSQAHPATPARPAQAGWARGGKRGAEQLPWEEQGKNRPSAPEERAEGRQELPRRPLPDREGQIPLRPEREAYPSLPG